jgi:HprK-related kinase A
MTTLLRDLAPSAAAERLRSGAGLRLRTGPFVAQVASPLADVGRAVLALYADHALADDGDFLDFDVAVHRPRGWRRWWQPQVVFRFEGEEPFNPLPGDQGFPLLEWGLNWCVYGMCHQYLILHAAVLERNGRALILPAPSGSGKSTLCAALLFSGWRLLSDELTLLCPQHGHVVPNPRPVSLKNASIDVIRRFAPEVRFGSIVHDTAKGVVGHFAAPEQALRRAHEPALPGWVVLPKYAAGAPAALQRIDRAQAFMQLVENAFNYDVFGAEGFQLLGSVIDRSDCFSFTYSDVHEAAALFAALADRGSPP